MQCRDICDLWRVFDVKMLQILIWNDTKLSLAIFKTAAPTKWDDGNSGELSHQEIF